jgi:hypothetical protein
VTGILWHLQQRAIRTFNGCLHTTLALCAWSVLFTAQPVFCLPDIPDIKGDDSNEPPSAGQVPKSDKKNKNGLSRMGSDIQKFGEEVAQRIDRIVKKKTFEWWGDPWTMQGIPILFPSTYDGFNLGFRLQLQNIRRQDPHQMEIIGQLMASDAGRYKHQAQVDLPYAFGGKYRITTRASYDRDISHFYFGIGNESPFDRAQLTAGSSLYQSTLAGPTINIQLLRYFSKIYRAGPVVGFRWMDVSTPAGSLLDTQRPVGIAGGTSHFWGLAVIRDTLDFEPYPSRGTYHELFLQYYGKPTGSDYEFVRGTYTYRLFVPVHRRLTFAHRTLIEGLSGQVPFYEMFTVGGTAWALAFGGDRFFRGYEANRFVDKLRLVLGFELRWDPFFINVMKQDLTIGFVPFFDIGRVWSRLWPLDLRTWHASAGWGLRLIWNSRLVFRVDTAFNPEGVKLAINLNNAF